MLRKQKNNKTVFEIKADDSQFESIMNMIKNNYPADHFQITIDNMHNDADTGNIHDAFKSIIPVITIFLIPISNIIVIISIFLLKDMSQKIIGSGAAAIIFLISVILLLRGRK